MSQLISEMFTEANSKQEYEVPDVFPNLSDWVVYIWADDGNIGIEVPMLMKVTSGDPSKGFIAGWAFMDPAQPFRGPNGTSLPATLIPIPSAAYCKVGKRKCWLHMTDFRAKLEKMQQEPEATVEAETQGGIHIPPADTSY